jgi:uncharacterized membrane protein YqjE
MESSQTLGPSRRWSFWARALIAASVGVGLPGLFIAVFGFSHGAATGLVALLLVLALAAIALAISSIVGVVVLLVRPDQRNVANYVAVAIAALASLLVIIPGFFGR